MVISQRSSLLLSPLAVPLLPKPRIRCAPGHRDHTTEAAAGHAWPLVRPVQTSGLSAFPRCVAEIALNYDQAAPLRGAGSGAPRAGLWPCRGPARRARAVPAATRSSSAGSLATRLECRGPKRPRRSNCPAPGCREERALPTYTGRARPWIPATVHGDMATIREPQPDQDALRSRSEGIARTTGGSSWSQPAHQVVTADQRDVAILTGEWFVSVTVPLLVVTVIVPTAWYLSFAMRGVVTLRVRPSAGTRLTWIVLVATGILFWKRLSVSVASSLAHPCRRSG